MQYLTIKYNIENNIINYKKLLLHVPTPTFRGTSRSLPVAPQRPRSSGHGGSCTSSEDNDDRGMMIRMPMSNIRALTIRIGLGGPLYYTYDL